MVLRHSMPYLLWICRQILFLLACFSFTFTIHWMSCSGSWLDWCCCRCLLVWVHLVSSLIIDGLQVLHLACFHPSLWLSHWCIQGEQMYNPYLYEVTMLPTCDSSSSSSVSNLSEACAICSVFPDPVDVFYDNIVKSCGVFRHVVFCTILMFYYG